MKNALSIFINLLIAHSAGFFGTCFTIPSIKSWYIYLNKPLFNPPSWIFGPVWSTLYTLIGISFYFFHKNNQYKDIKIYILYIFHIFLNAIWSFIFFKQHEILIALFDIFMMIITLLILMKYFYKLQKISFYLLIPYLMWLCFAFILNFNIWLLN